MPQEVFDEYDHFFDLFIVLLQDRITYFDEKLPMEENIFMLSKAIGSYKTETEAYF